MHRPPRQDEGVRLAYEQWPNAGLPGELSRVLYAKRVLPAAGR